MRLIDSHCHLDFPVFQQLPEVLRRAETVGVTQFVVPGVNAANWQAVLELSRQYSQISAALGIHPCFLDEQSEASLTGLRALYATHADELVAVGEIGLDLYDKDADQQQQLKILNIQLQLAKDFNKPVILHVRKAHDLMLQQLRRAKLPKGGVVHAFTGSEQQAKEYIKLGFSLGVGGSITYERAQKVRRTFSNLPLESLVLETDSPDMPLSGYQGEVNYPERVALVAETLAELRQESQEDIAKVTSKNAVQLFGLPK